MDTSYKGAMNMSWGTWRRLSNTHRADHIIHLISLSLQYKHVQLEYVHMCGHEGFRTSSELSITLKMQ